MQDDQAASHPQTATQKIMSLTLFILVSALFYAGAMIAMKYWGKLPPVLVIGVIVICFAFGAWAEIGALQVERLAIVYVLILGLECIVIAAASALMFGETFSWKEIAGGSLIVLGTAVVWS